MMSREIRKEYTQGRKKNFFLREHNGMYFLEKITKSCAFTIKAGTQEEVIEYIEKNNYKFIGLLVL